MPVVYASEKGRRIEFYVHIVRQKYFYRTERSRGVYYGVMREKCFAQIERKLAEGCRSIGSVKALSGKTFRVPGKAGVQLLFSPLSL